MKFKFLFIFTLVASMVSSVYAEPIAEVVNMEALSDSVGNAEEVAEILEANEEQMHNSQEAQTHWNLSRKGYSFTFGGFINLRASYDFNGSLDCVDFLPSLMEPSREDQLANRTFLDASTSRLFFNALIDTKKLGTMNIFIEGDFRGGAYGSYTPRIRLAYLKFMGITAGRDHTTFSDLSSMPYCVDFAGPNSCPFNFVTMLRYEHFFMNDKLKLAIALEDPYVSAQYGDNYQEVPQLTPDIPFYAQYFWGENLDSHVRAAGVFKAMTSKSIITNETENILGWGAQLSGNMKVAPFASLMYSAVYGHGISNYIVDFIGMGLDFAPNPNDNTMVSATTMWGYQIATQINASDDLWFSAGFSQTDIKPIPLISTLGNSDKDYKGGTYIFGNVFYNLTPRLQIACEYVYGSRKNMDLSTVSANRALAMIQYNF